MRTNARCARSWQLPRLHADGGEVPRTIDVTMGITNDCNSVPGANFMVQTWTQ